MGIVELDSPWTISICSDHKRVRLTTDEGHITELLIWGTGLDGRKKNKLGLANEPQHYVCEHCGVGRKFLA